MVIHFNEEYQHAAKLAENSEGLDFSEKPECALCHKEEPRCLLCGACLAMLYCSPECSKNAWSDRALDKSGSIAPGHRLMCEQNKAQMSKMPEFQAILKQFPWARLENDGTFQSRLFLATRGLLGTGKNFGFWSEEPCCGEHGLESWEWGMSLFQREFPDDRDGWKLNDEETPWIHFDEEHKPPTSPPKFENSWKSYYEWRGLSLTSPAALLLHWPLTVYHLLNQLKVVSPPSAERKSLLLHYLGAQEELDYLPVFAELTLLLPNTDIELVMFGDAVYVTLHTAREFSDPSNPSIITKAKDDIIYSYVAPESSGGSKIRIVLWGGGPNWTPEVLRFGAPFPDAIIGMNAGLAAYPEWQSAIVSSRAFGIPFALTEFMEASVEMDKRLIRGLTVELPESANDWKKETYGEVGAANLRLDHKMESTMNPFMRPGQKTGGAWSRLPAAVNGFTLVVMPSAKRKEEEQKDEGKNETESQKMEQKPEEKELGS